MLISPELDHEVVYELVFEELFYKGEMPHWRRQVTMRDAMYVKLTERSSQAVVEF